MSTREKYDSIANNGAIQLTDNSKVAQIELPEINVKTADIEMKAKGYAGDFLLEVIRTLVGPNRLLEAAEPPNFDLIDSIGKREIENTKPRHEVSSDDLVDSIDMSELKAKERLPRTSYNFRCPHCAQGFIAKMFDNRTSMWVFRSVSDENVVSREVNVSNIVIEDRKDKNELIKIYEGLEHIAGDKVLLLYQEGQNGYCPLCNQDAPLMDWMDAYSSPLNYFEVSNMCDICGDAGSLVMTELAQYCECSDLCLSKTKGLDKPKPNEDVEGTKEESKSRKRKPKE